MNGTSQQLTLPDHGPIVHSGRVRFRCAHIRWRSVLAAVLVGLAAGCSRGPEFVEVEGIVTQDGKPLPEVEVVFLPNSAKGNYGPRAAAYTDAQGHYKLFCDQANRNGTVVGPTRVCIIDITAIGSLNVMPGVRMPGELAVPDAKAEKKEKGKVSRLPADYKSPSRTPLHVDVQPGQPTHNFDIPSAKRR